MTPILVVIPFCLRDLEQAKGLLEWIGYLGGAKNNPLLLMADIKVPSLQIKLLKNEARNYFQEVYSVTTPRSLPNERWPLGPNWMFRNAVLHIKATIPGPFFWMEPDCVPLKPGWLDSLQQEYRSHGRPFMGAVVHSSGNPNMPGDHLTGCAIYPENVYKLIRSTFQDDRAFDMAHARIVLSQTHNTRLIQHFWGDQNLLKGPLPDGFIRPESVCFHRDKNLSLVPILKGLL